MSLEEVSEKRLKKKRATWLRYPYSTGTSSTKTTHVVYHHPYRHYCYWNWGENLFYLVSKFCWSTSFPSGPKFGYANKNPANNASRSSTFFSFESAEATDLILDSPTTMVAINCELWSSTLFSNQNPASLIDLI